MIWSSVSKRCSGRCAQHGATRRAFGRCGDC
ncbi:hypothetical protein MLPM_0525 [Mycobacterium lepromatosis]|uniref:Uncharacterized protein n=1 Tax=Mycobacterium lepromatosis TaxID=480418 RepID=A0A0F4ESR8_9MYCO|nr:hypothetical protein MLPM_0525 [Mycobacterium lepromatosis]